MKQPGFFTALILMAGIMAACCSARKTETAQKNAGSSMPGPKVIIYQTTRDFSKQVPINLSDDGKTIVSYPDIKDVYFEGSLAYPTQLHKGYFLDNRGITKNAAFLDITYETYSKLAVTPSPDELMKMIIDSHPVSKMYSCGLRSSYKDLIQELNAKIDADDFSAFTRLK
jgi:hypothetical protein